MEPNSNCNISFLIGLAGLVSTTEIPCLASNEYTLQRLPGSPTVQLDYRSVQCYDLNAVHYIVSSVLALGAQVEAPF